MPWGSNRVLADLMDQPDELHVFAPRWGPLFWNLADHSAAELLQTGDAWMQALAVLRAQAEDPATYQKVLHDVLGQLDRLRQTARARWEELVRFAITHALLRRPAAERDSVLATVRDVFQQRSPEEVTTMTKTIADVIREEGKKEGSLFTARKMLRSVVMARFRTVPEALDRRSKAITDPDELEAAIPKVSEATTVEELQL